MVWGTKKNGIRVFTSNPRLEAARKEKLKLLELQGKKSKKAMRRQARKMLKAKEAQGASQSEVAVADGSKSTAEMGNDSDLNQNDNEKARPSFEMGNMKKNENKKHEETRVVHGPNSERNVAGLKKHKEIRVDHGSTSERNVAGLKKHGEIRGDHRPNSQRNVAGLIFMCNTKTKPDCFRYKIMALSAGKKNVVLGIKSGLKLFLYDFDLKLLYGIYEASSAGGMNLEPAAFGGGFPAQVGFRIYEDCFPLPETVFKKAIMENYDQRTNKFKTELTSKQVTKLKSLFRPIPQSHKDHPVAQHPSSSSGLITKDDYHKQDTLRIASIPEPYRSSQYTGQAIQNPVSIYRDTPSTGEQIFGDRMSTYRKLSSTQEQIVGDPAFRYGSLSSLRTGQTEYPLHGLRGQTDPSSEMRVARAREVDHYPENHYLPGSDSYYHVTSSDPCIHLPARGSAYGVYSQMTMTSYSSDLNPGIHAIDYSLPRSVPNEGSYYPSHELPYYNQRNNHLGFPADNAPAPVSSRYSFAGGSYSHR